MHSCFVASIATTLFLISAESTAQGLPPAPPTPAPSPTVPNAAPSATPDAPGPGTPPPPAGGSSAMPPGPGQTTLPQATPYPQPYPYPYYPPPHYGQGYPPGWAQRPAEPKMKTEWYGWQTLIGVVTSDLLTLTGAFTGGGPFMYIGIAGHVLMGPVVHWSHGHVGRGFASLGFNVGLPGIGILTGLLLSDSSDFGGILAMVTLGGIGYLAAPTLDIALLSTEEVRDTTTIVPKSARALLPSSVAIMPMLDQNRRGLMLVGQF